MGATSRCLSRRNRYCGEDLTSYENVTMRNTTDVGEGKNALLHQNYECREKAPNTHHNTTASRGGAQKLSMN